MATLFDLTGDALQLRNRIDEISQRLFSDDTEEALKATEEIEMLLSQQEGSQTRLLQKADAYCWVLDELRAIANAQAEHAKRLLELSKTAERRADSLQDRLIAMLERVDPNATTWKLPKHTIKSRASTSVLIDPLLDPQDLPTDLQRVKVEPDKTAIKQALQSGTTLDGCTLIEKRSWTIQ